MINLEWLDADGQRIAMNYDVHPRSQDKAITVPAGAARVVVWLGMRVEGQMR